LPASTRPSSCAKPRLPMLAVSRSSLVTHWVPQKGQLLILEALATLRSEGVDVELVLTGDGPLRARLSRRTVRDVAVMETP